MRVLLFAGKGGVGKTSLAAATALRAAAHGHRVFLLSTDAAHNLGDAFGRAVGPRPVEVAPGVVAQEVAALAELDRAWSEIAEWLRGLLRTDADEVVAEELLVFPGLEEIVALRAVREVESTGAYDLCVVDCAPTGAMLRLLRFPDALRVFMGGFFDLKRAGARAVRPIAERIGAGRFVPRDSVFAAFERLYGEVAEVQRVLLDAERTTARLVLNPARVVIDETRRSFAYLNLYGVATDAVLVNRVLPREAGGGYFARWVEREAEALAEIESSFPVPVLRAPLADREPIGAEALTALGQTLYGERDPAERFSGGRPIRLSQRGEAAHLEIDLPHAARGEIDVSVHGDELLVRVRDALRRIALPAAVAGRAVSSVQLSDGVLDVAFAP